LIHRDYGVIGSEVHIDIYDDRLEVYSPGGMYDGTFVQDVDPYNVCSVRRNPIIADVFSRMNLMERRGSGLRKIIESYEFEEKYKEKLKPEFRSTEVSFHTNLMNLNFDGQNDGQNDGQSDGQNDGQKLQPKQRRTEIIRVIEANPKATALELSKLLLVSKSTIERDLAQLRDEGHIEYEGSAKTGEWKLNK